MFNRISNIFQPQSSNVISFSGAKKNKPEPKKYYGQIQYFYSDPDSNLPVRDVLNKQKAGNKTEPHIENGSENFLKPCVQHNIRAAVNNSIGYLFLITKCVNKKFKDFFGDQFVVGYIKVKEGVERTKDDKKFVAAKGDVKMVSFEDGIRVKDLFGMNLSRTGIAQHGRLNKELTDKIAHHIDSKTDITDKCIDEIIKLDVNNLTCIGKSCSSCGECTRFKKMQDSSSKQFVA